MTRSGLSKRIFAISFSVSFLVLAALAVGTVTVLSPRVSGQRAAPQTEFAGKEKVSGYLPSADEALTVLFIGAKREGEQPGSFLLAGFEPLSGRVPILALPPGLEVTLGEEVSTLGDVYRVSGPAGAKAALAQTLGVAVERYVRLDWQGFVDAADLIGQVEYSLPYTVALERFGSAVVIDSGNQRLDGKRAADLIGYSGYPGGELGRMRVMGELASQVVNQRLELVTSPAVEGLFRQIVGLVDTDISHRDYEYRIQAARFLAKLQVNPAVNIPLLGEFDLQGRFHMSQTTRALVEKLFHTRP